MLNNIWCPLPWTHIAVKNNGALRICSHSQSGNNTNTLLKHNDQELSIDNIEDAINCDTLKQVRQDFLNQVWPEQCRRCRLDAEVGYRSRNIWETERHANTFTKEQAQQITLPDGTVTEQHIQSFDLRVGNQCNLRCVMCFPGEATLWYKDYQTVTDSDSFYVDQKKYSLIPADGDFNWIRAEHKVKKLISVSKELNKIKFGGGEPLIIKHHRDLVQGLIDEGYSKNIELEYSVNLTVFPPDLFELWQHFKCVKICASIDAFGIANDAIRYPSQWSTVANNLKMLDDTPDNIQVFTSTTISLLSLEHFSKLMVWIKEQNFKKVNKCVYDFIATHPVASPEYLNIGLLEDYQRDRIFELLKCNVNDKSMMSKLVYYENYSSNTNFENADMYRNQFVSRFNKFSVIQKQNWSGIFPEAYKVLNEWKK